MRKLVLAAVAAAALALTGSALAAPRQEHNFIPATVAVCIQGSTFQVSPLQAAAVVLTHTGTLGACPAHAAAPAPAVGGPAHVYLCNAGLYIDDVADVPHALATGSRYAYEVIGKAPAGAQPNANSTGWFQCAQPAGKQLAGWADNDGYLWLLPLGGTVGYPEYVA